MAFAQNYEDELRGIAASVCGGPLVIRAPAAEICCVLRRAAMRDNLNDFSGDIALCSRSDPDGNTSRGQVVKRGVLTLINTFGAKDFERQNA